ncbi:MAG: GGDEF domain-containing protein [Proteobacteria bacterium]|nr:GGDEF domain-containing protein [Pseudomonadota bacterium]MBU1640801.1 GGDEF domain-containing protein [Pseudomonadota bacterium]
MEEQTVYTTPVESENRQHILDELLREMEQLKEKADRLILLNDLHARLASAVDLPSMIDAFSVWLMPRVPHELMAFDAPDNKRRHLCCSCHGPERQQVVGLAERLFGEARRLPILRKWKEGDFFIHNWPLDFAHSSGIILVMRQDKRLSGIEEEMVSEALTVLFEPLQRALAYEDVFKQAKCDALTGLANRRVFEDRLGPLIESARRHGHPLTLVSMDLDHFKQVNDHLGHATGDEVLKKVAQTFGGMIRSSDILVRMGGDEFMLVLPDTDHVSARILAERLCKAVDEMDIYSTDDLKLGVSIGLSQWQPGVPEEEWLERIDVLLYKAKGHGRNQVYVESGMN